jgi:hypothetical protein
MKTIISYRFVSAVPMHRKTDGLSQVGAFGIHTKKTGWKAMSAGWSARVNSTSARLNDGFSRRPIGEMPVGGFWRAAVSAGLSPTPGDAGRCQSQDR